MATVFHSILQRFQSKDEALASFNKEAERLKDHPTERFTTGTEGSFIGEKRCSRYPVPRFFSRWENWHGTWAWVQYENY